MCAYVQVGKDDYLPLAALYSVIIVILNVSLWYGYSQGYKYTCSSLRHKAQLIPSPFLFSYEALSYMCVCFYLHFCERKHDAFDFMTPDFLKEKMLPLCATECDSNFLSEIILHHFRHKD